MGFGSSEDIFVSQLNRLLKPGELRPFIDRHPEFSWSATGPKGMMVTWASDCALALVPLPPATPAPASKRCLRRASATTGTSTIEHLDDRTRLMAHRRRNGSCAMTAVFRQRHSPWPRRCRMQYVDYSFPRALTERPFSSVAGTANSKSKFKAKLDWRKTRAKPAAQKK